MRVKLRNFYTVLHYTTKAIFRIVVDFTQFRIAFYYQIRCIASFTKRRGRELDFCKNVVHIPTTKVVYNLCKQNCHFIHSGLQSVTNSVNFKIFWHKFEKKKNILAERSFDLRTSGLWAQHASTAPLCCWYRTPNKICIREPMSEQTLCQMFFSRNW